MEGGIGDTCLHWAAQACQLNSLQFLGEKGVDLNLQNDLGWNAVIWASSNSDGMLMAVEKLYQLGMNVVTSTSMKEEKLNLPVNNRLTKMTPIMWLIPSGNVEGIKEMINYGVDINAKNAKGLTALMFAVAAGKKELLKVLQECGAELDIRMKAHKQTPAHWAARNGKASIANELIKLGANKRATDADGRTVSDLLSIQDSSSYGKESANDEPSGIGESVGEKSRTDVRAAEYMWSLESMLCENNQ